MHVVAGQEDVPEAQAAIDGCPSAIRKPEQLPTNVRSNCQQHTEQSWCQLQQLDAPNRALCSVRVLLCHSEIVKAFSCFQLKFRAMLESRAGTRQADIRGGWMHTLGPRRALIIFVYALVSLYIALCVYLLLIFGTSRG